MDTSRFTNDKAFQALLDRSNLRMFDAMKATINAALPDYFESMARAYARQFSPDDLQVILTFATTPAGQHYFAESTNILKDPDVQAAGQRMTAKLIEKMPEIQRQSMQDIEAYIAEKEKQANNRTHAS